MEWRFLHNTVWPTSMQLSCSYMLSILKPQEANAIVKCHFHASYPTSTLHLIKSHIDHRVNWFIQSCYVDGCLTSCLFVSDIQRCGGFLLARQAIEVLCDTVSVMCMSLHSCTHHYIQSWHTVILEIYEVSY